MKTYFILFSLLISSLGFGQNKSDLIGQWNFDAIHCAAKKDSSFIALTKTLYKDLSIHFLNENEYKSKILNRVETGVWSIVANKNKIVLSAKNGALVDIKIINYTSNKLIAKIGNIEFILKK